MKSRLETPKRESARPASEWFSECDTQEEKDKLREYIQNSTPLLDHLKAMIQKRYDAAMQISSNEYNEGWQYKQADRNGRLRTLEEIYKLLP